MKEFLTYWGLSSPTAQLDLETLFEVTDHSLDIYFVES